MVQADATQTSGTTETSAATDTGNATLDALERQQKQWLTDAQANHRAACDEIVDLEGKLAEARTKRDKWASKVRQLTPHKPRVCKPRANGGGTNG